MINKKRIIVATIGGLIAGFMCVSGGMIMFGMTFTPLAILFALSSRLSIGFVIGISSLKMPWTYHGLLIGAIIGFPFPIYDLITGQGPVIYLVAFSMSCVFGVLI